MKLLRDRWVTVCVTALTVVLGTIIFTLLQTPLYQASTRLFVSTSGSSINDIYQGNRFSQERVISYTELIKGATLGQRTIDKLDLKMSTDDFRKKITAVAKMNTVLIFVDVTDASAVRARDIANTLSDEFVLMVRELETPRPGATPDARVIVEQRATIPDKPVSPKKTRNIVTGFGFGLMMGIFLAFLRERIDNTLKDQEDLENVTGVGVVGTIPLDKSSKILPVIEFETENSAISEAFRKLRTNLQFLTVDNPPRVIVLTSSVPNEGKSTTSINIALAIAEAENSVALIDGDLRRPSIAKYLGLPDAVGLSTVLSGGVPLADALQATKYPNLTVLAAGPTPPNPSELLGSQSAKNLINDLRDKFDYVIIDSPPVLAVTDAAILTANSDGALLLAKFGATKTDQVAHSVGNLAKIGAKLLGSVLVMVPTRGLSNYYGYGYSYVRYYEDSARKKQPVINRVPRTEGD